MFVNHDDDSAHVMTLNILLVVLTDSNFLIQSLSEHCCCCCPATSCNVCKRIVITFNQVELCIKNNSSSQFLAGTDALSDKIFLNVQGDKLIFSNALCLTVLTKISIQSITLFSWFPLFKSYWQLCSNRYIWRVLKLMILSLCPICSQRLSWNLTSILLWSLWTWK